MGGCWDTENETLNNWEMLSNKGLETANQWEHGMATRQPITTLLIFLVWSTGPLLIFFGRPDGKLFLSFLPILLCQISCWWRFCGQLLWFWCGDNFLQVEYWTEHCQTSSYIAYMLSRRVWRKCCGGSLRVGSCPWPRSAENMCCPQPGEVVHGGTVICQGKQKAGAPSK